MPLTGGLSEARFSKSGYQHHEKARQRREEGVRNAVGRYL